MKILILGVSGMLGHKLYEILSKDPCFDVYGTLRHNPDYSIKNGLFKSDKILYPINVLELNKLKGVICNISPAIVINCVGIVKNVNKKNNLLDLIELNALFPHQLLKICYENHTKLIHISTDGVFSGKKGMYKECDNADAFEYYGRTKYLGEVDYGNALTIRTSIIGEEIKRSSGFYEWIISMNNKDVIGYKKSIFSGFTTIRFSQILKWIIREHIDLFGLYHISSTPISKFDLITKLKEHLHLNISIIPDYNVKIDRCLDCNEFINITDFEPPTWDEMIHEFVNDIEISE